MTLKECFEIAEQEAVPPRTAHHTKEFLWRICDADLPDEMDLRRNGRIRMTWARGNRLVLVFGSICDPIGFSYLENQGETSFPRAQGMVRKCLT